MSNPRSTQPVQPSLALSGTGRVLPRESLLRKGLCPTCGQTQTHDIIRQRFSFVKVPREEMRDKQGNRVVCHGMCLLPTCNRGNMPPPPLPEIEALLKKVVESRDPEQVSDVVVKIMSETPEAKEIQRACLTSLWTVFKHHDHFKTTTIPAKLPDRIIQCMKNHPTDASLQELACVTVWALSETNIDNRGVVIQSGASRSIICMMLKHKANEAVVWRAVGCLRSLSEAPNCGHTIRKGITGLCEVMRIHRANKTIQADGCRLLSNSIVDLDNKMVAKASESELTSILKGMTRHKDEETVRAAGCTALLNYTYQRCENGEHNLRALCQCSEALQTISHAYMTAERSESRQHSTCVLDRVQNMLLEESLIREQLNDTSFASATSLSS